MLLSFQFVGDDYMQVKQRAHVNDNAKPEKVKQKCAVSLESGAISVSRADERVPHERLARVPAAHKAMQNVGAELELRPLVFC
jgi:hypothetical protein